MPITKRKYFNGRPVEKTENAPIGTVVALLLDRSGSMRSIYNETIDAVNAYVDGLRSTDARFYLAQFDSYEPLKNIYFNEPMSRLPKRVLSRENYEPRGDTPLFDATMMFIKQIEEVHNERNRVVIAIQTDGQENSSRKYNISEIQAAVKACQDKNWAVTFIGTGIDNWAGRNMGIGNLSTFARNDIIRGMQVQHMAARNYIVGNTTASAFYRGVHDDKVETVSEDDK